jgi:hypothetical protein
MAWPNCINGRLAGEQVDQRPECALGPGILSRLIGSECRPGSRIAHGHRRPSALMRSLGLFVHPGHYTVTTTVIPPNFFSLELQMMRKALKIQLFRRVALGVRQPLPATH